MDHKIVPSRDSAWPRVLAPCHLPWQAEHCSGSDHDAMALQARIGMIALGPATMRGPRATRLAPAVSGLSQTCHRSLRSSDHKFKDTSAASASASPHGPV